MPRAGLESRRLAGLGVRLSATLVAAGVLAVTFALSGFVLVSFVHRSLLAAVDDAALARGRDVAALAAAGRLSGSVASTSEESSLVQVVGPGNTVLASTGNIDGEPPAIAAQPSPRAERVLTGSALPLSDSLQQFRIAAVPVALPQGPGWVYVATSLRSVQTTVSGLTRALVLGLPALLGVVSVVLWLTIGRALRPVERIRSRTESIGAIGAAALDARVPVPPSRDEIARLATTINTMLNRLEAASARQKQFLGDVSHELKSPLSAMRAQIDVALLHPESSERPEELRRLRDQSDRMGLLVDDLLFLARTDEGGTAHDTERVDLDELVWAEAHRLRELGTQVSLTRLDAVGLAGNAPALSRMLRNLGDNARSHARSTVELALIASSGEAALVVTDDGPGVPEAARETVFGRFTRLEPHRSRTDGGGTGLGLAIVREIARSHAGSVLVGDRPDGLPGAAFTVRLPYG